MTNDIVLSYIWSLETHRESVITRWLSQSERIHLGIIGPNSYWYSQTHKQKSNKNPAVSYSPSRLVDKSQKLFLLYWRVVSSTKMSCINLKQVTNVDDERAIVLEIKCPRNSQNGQISILSFKWCGSKTLPKLLPDQNTNVRT